jgi:dTDP-4-amino-4,6-dideoxygalactose transaminase
MDKVALCEYWERCSPAKSPEEDKEMIPLFNTSVTPEEKELVNQVLDSGSFCMGKNVRDLEAELGAYFGQEAVTCASGTDALAIILKTWGVEGFAVILPAMTFSATYEAVLMAGGIPVVCDVDQDTFTPTLDQLRDRIAECIYGGIPVAAVITVSLYGWPAYELVEIRDFCKAQRFRLLEDCAQSFGARIGDQYVGTFGDAAAFSFYPTKPLGGIGDGGAAIFKDQKEAAQAKAMRNHGRDERGVQLSAGFNSRLDEVNAAVLRSRLQRHEENINARRAISGRYHFHGFKKLSMRRMGRGVPYVYPILVTENREAVRFRLAEAGVQTGIHYDPPISGLPYTVMDCPNARWISERIISLPCHQGMNPEDVDSIADAIRSA